MPMKLFCALGVARNALPLLALLALWEVVVRLRGVAPYILPAPLQVAERMVDSLDILLPHALYSLTSILTGFVAAVVSGFVLAVMISYSRLLQRLFEPLIVVLQVVPKVALAPLFLIWFGHGLAPKIIIVGTIAFFPILVNTIVGLKSAESDVIELMESVAANKAQIFWKIRLPTALPYFMAGVRISGGLSLIGTVVAEFVAGSGGADSGLAFRILEAGYRLQIPRLFAALILLSIAVVAIHLVLGLISRRVLRGWHESEIGHP